MTNKIVAVDFDGTLFENSYPQIGLPKWNVINKCKELMRKGVDLILWTCRESTDLENAVNACLAVGLEFKYINENPQWAIDKWSGNDSRKVGADYYIDDKNLSIEEFINAKI